MRSGFELTLAKNLEERGVAFEYETLTIDYRGAPRKYKPDFILENGIIIEAKGRLTVDNRTKHLLVKAQHPEHDIRFVFQADNPINKGSTTRYSDWCEKHGFQYAIREIPQEWIDE